MFYCLLRGCGVVQLLDDDDDNDDETIKLLFGASCILRVEKLIIITKYKIRTQL